LRIYLIEKSSGYRSRKQRLTAVGTRCADHVTPLYPQKLALTSPTGGCRSVGIVRVRTKATEFSFMRLEWGKCSSIFPHPGRIACCPAPDRRPPVTKALHTICGNNTSIVSSSWWWAYKSLKHVEQIISAINHSVAFSWFSSLRM